MKPWIYISTALMLGLSLGAKAQETDNISNRYGPPYYTGGTVQSPSETFADYHANTTSRNSLAARESAFISNVSPNPARTNASINLESGTTEPVSIYVVNMNGTILKSYTYGAGSNSYGIDMGNLPAGLYSIQLQERGKSLQSIELVKQD